MTTYKVAFLAIIFLAVFSLAVLLYWRSRPPRGLGNPPAAVANPCRFLPNSISPGDDCHKKCGPDYERGYVQATINGTTWLFCCPAGYAAGFDQEINDIKCYKK